MAKESMTADEVRKALRAKFCDRRRYAIAEEVGLTTGGSHRRLDMMVLDCYYSNGFRIDGIEIKVSTSDLRRELADPEKHIAFFDVIDYYTLACPAGVVEPLIDVIPKKWGILIINEDGSTRYKRKPLALEDRKADRTIPRGFFASVTRAIQQYQPSAQELLAEYNRGLKEATEKIKSQRDYMSERIARESEKLEEYDKLISRFHLYGHDIEKTMNEFEAFRNMNIDWVKSSIDRTAKNLVELSEKLVSEGVVEEGAT